MLCNYMSLRQAGCQRVNQVTAPRLIGPFWEYPSGVPHLACGVRTALDYLAAMEYKGIQYNVVQTVNPTGFRWTVQLDVGHTRWGFSHSMNTAILDARHNIDQELEKSRALSQPA